MKIIHVGLTEFDTLEELENTFFNMDGEMTKNGCQLVSSKKKAEENLKFQFENLNKLGSRVFWHEKVDYEGRITYTINEAVFD
jgi:hypothetical protein